VMQRIGCHALTHPQTKQARGEGWDCLCTSICIFVK